MSAATRDGPHTPPPLLLSPVVAPRRPPRNRLKIPLKQQLRDALNSRRGFLRFLLFVGFAVSALLTLYLGVAMHLAIVFPSAVFINAAAPDPIAPSPPEKSQSHLAAQTGDATTKLPRAFQLQRIIAKPIVSGWATRLFNFLSALRGRRPATHGVKGCEQHFVNGVAPKARPGISIVAPGAETTDPSATAEYLNNAAPGTDAAVDLCHGKGYYFSRQNTAHRIPEFAAFKLTRAGVTGESDIRPQFLPTDALPRKYQMNDLGSRWNDTTGYQSRGHLCFKAGLKQSFASQDATFDLTNIVPQVFACNAKDWARIEAQQAKYVKSQAQNRSLFVITGVTLPKEQPKGKFPELEAASITIPEMIWTVFCDLDRGISAGFYGWADIPGCGCDTFKWRTVREVEKLYGGSLLPKRACNTNEVNEGLWKFKFPPEFACVRAIGTG